MTELTAARLRELLHYDPETGVFTRRVSVGRRGHIKAGVIAGNVHPEGYVRIKIDNRYYQAHRLAWLYVTGAWPTQNIDHRNGRRGDNRFANLRDVSQKLNSENMREASTANKIGVLGVSASYGTSGRWRARIKTEGRIINLGNHDTPEAAHAAYVAAKRRIHEGCTL